ncbi:ATP-binding protein [Catellatospora sp. NPDC049609]|uniref:ATP-binding protein n=1 Tax=Catellatospora sp. NPDC049609 TaxID=3155505 RepID=UPI00342C4DAD
MATGAREWRVATRLGAAVAAPLTALAATSAVLVYQAVADATAAERLAGGSAAAEQAWGRVVTTSFLVVLAFVGAVAVSVVIGRSLLTSLRELRGRALALTAELPATFDRVRSGQDEPPADTPAEAGDTAAQVGDAPAGPARDELGQAAAALDEVRRTAVALAARQARSRHAVNGIFTNLARRSQILVERQLRLLDEMERDERDPDRLSALFKLDHLAARLRRNDENLLVLAGAEPRRRWREGVPLAALALAALSEIEQYERVRADVDESLHIAGHAAADIGHLLAELLDNATAFSAPHTAVRVGAHAVDGGALVEIVDEGIGLGERALAEANALLAVPAEVDVANSERMGLVVVSHLAARHGLRVSLSSVAGGGTRAAAVLPAALLVEPAGGRARPAPPTVEPPRAPQRRREPDPAATAATLTRLYEGVRRGQAGDGATAPPPEPDDLKGEA